MTSTPSAGGSYVVSRENFGTNVAQIAAVALIIDYVVTVAVQVAAGTDAVTSAFPALQAPHRATIAIGVVILMAYGNLRGIARRGKVFAVPTYLFVVDAASWSSSVLDPRRARPAPRRTRSTSPVRFPSGTRVAGLLTGRASVFVAPAGVRERRLFADGPRGRCRTACATFRPPEGQRPPRARHDVHDPRRRSFSVSRSSPISPTPCRTREHIPRSSPRRRRYVFGTDPVGQVLLLLAPGVDGAHPLHRGQHELQRLPLPRELRRQGRLPPTLAHQARAPPQLLQRHPGPGPGGRFFSSWSPMPASTPW